MPDLMGQDRDRSYQGLMMTQDNNTLHTIGTVYRQRIRAVMVMLHAGKIFDCVS